MNLRKSLLVVDDNEMNRDLLVRRLEREGYAVLKSDSGQQALNIVTKVPVDLLLLDVDMPDLDGFEVLKRLRESFSSAQLPVIMVTALSASEDVVKALRLGASDYVTKPIDFPVVLARINTQLERKRVEDALRESEERYALAARGANDGLWDLDMRTNQIYLSPRWKSMLGWREEEIGTDPEEWFRRVHAEDVALLRANLQAHLDGIAPHFESEYRMRHRDGSYLWMLGRGLAVRDGSGKAYRVAGSQTDITRSKVADALTGLPNRILFVEQLSRCLERARRYRDYCFAVIFLDLDEFKLINESLGHVTGDQLLIATAQRLESCLRSADVVARLGSGYTVARLGGDEFVVLLDNIKTAGDVTSVAERIKAELSKPLTLRGQEIFTTASMGIALNCPSYERPEDLLRDADTAMYRAKLRGKSCHEIFDAEMRASTVARLKLETELRHALERDEVAVFYQPVVSLHTGAVAGFEALLRWFHPTRGLILPGDFISVAEETGLIIEMEEWVLREASRQMKVWQGRFPASPPLQIAVNLSSRHFIRHDLQEHYVRILSETGLDPSSVSLEVTESTVVPHPALAADIMTGLKKHGFKIAIDDFGTGYSSLSYLQRFPFDCLKIDRTFTSRLRSCEDNSEIVRTIVMLAHNLGMHVVVEGVETEEQRRLLRELGCEYAQGHLFARALPAPRAEVWLASAPGWL